MCASGNRRQINEYTNLGSNFTVQSKASEKLKNIDCITCHNRVSHDILNPAMRWMSLHAAWSRRPAQDEEKRSSVERALHLE